MWATIITGPPCTVRLETKKRSDMLCSISGNENGMCSISGNENGGCGAHKRIRSLAWRERAEQLACKRSGAEGSALVCVQMLCVTNLPPCLFDHTPPGVFDGQGSGHDFYGVSFMTLHSSPLLHIEHAIMAFNIACKFDSWRDFACIGFSALHSWFYIVTYANNTSPPRVVVTV